tara:strand:+ start:1516 stop:2241 length:726 start_codon:yes stop_codon:yes gene_type:complete
MNINDLSKFSLGQYGSVKLTSGNELSLLGSSKYLIGALHILSNRESTSQDYSFVSLNCCESSPLYWGTSFGGNRVLQFDGNNVSTSDNTIKVDNSVDWQYIRVGSTCNYWKRGQGDSGLGLTSTALSASTLPQSATQYFVVSKDERNKTIQLSTTLTGAPISLQSQSQFDYPKRALTFPSIQAHSEARIQIALDADSDNNTGGVFTSGDNIVEGVILYGRWNYVCIGTNVGAVAYLIPRIL